MSRGVPRKRWVEILCAEDPFHILSGSLVDRGEMCRNGLHRPRLVVVPIQHQHRADMHGAVGDLAAVHFRGELILRLRGAIRQGVVGVGQGNVGDQTEEAPTALSLDDDIAADRQTFNG